MSEPSSRSPGPRGGLRASVWLRLAAAVFALAAGSAAIVIAVLLVRTALS